MYGLKPIFRLLFPSLSSGFLNILAPFWPITGRLPPRGGFGSYGDSPAKSPFQTGPAAGNAVSQRPAGVWCLICIEPARSHLSHSGMYLVMDWGWTATWGPCSIPKALFIPELPDRLAEDVTNLHHNLLCICSLHLQGLIPNKHLHPKLHRCVPPENPAQTVGDMARWWDFTASPLHDARMSSN